MEKYKSNKGLMISGAMTFSGSAIQLMMIAFADPLIDQWYVAALNKVAGKRPFAPATKKGGKEGKEGKWVWISAEDQLKDWPDFD